MRTRTKELDGLLRLPSLGDRSARKAAFVAAMTALARGAMEGEPSALDGVEPAALSAAVKTAIGASLFDDPELPATTLAVAMFELGGALATGPEKREVGRRVLAMLHEGSAEVIAAIATRMAVASRKGLATSAVTSRLALIFAMPLPTPFAQALAWAICTQAELAREWIAVASIGSLADRTTAARILEQAAVVAARRRADGDDEATVLFATDPIARAFARLIRDRDLGVWRHAASARGLIAGGSTRGWRDLGEALNAPLSGVDWRRAAVAIVASSAIDPDRGLRKSREILGGALPAHDRGLVGAMVWGLPRVFDELPDQAEELARALVQTDAAGTAEPLALLLGDSAEIGGDARAKLLPLVRTGLQRRASALNGDEGDMIHAQALIAELTDARGTASGSSNASSSAAELVGAALHAFLDKGSRDAHPIAVQALEAVKAAIQTLEKQGADAAPASNRGGAIAGASATLAGGMLTVPGGMPSLTSVLQGGKRGGALALRDLDRAVLEDARLPNLLALKRVGDDDPHAATLEDARDRIGRWVLAQERMGAEARRKDVGLRSRRLLALSHVLDSKLSASIDSPSAVRARAFLVESLGVLTARLGTDRQWQVQPSIVGAVGATLDALVRDGGSAPPDLLMTLASTVHAVADVAAITEACTQPSLVDPLTAYASLLSGIDSFVTPTPPSGASQQRKSMRASSSRIALSPGKDPIEDLLELAATMSRDDTGRSDPLRDLLERLGRALGAIRNVPFRKALVDDRAATIEPLSATLEAYAQLEVAARLRVMSESSGAQARSGATPGRLLQSLKRLAQPQKVDAQAALSSAQAELKLLVPPPLAKLVGEILARTVALQHAPTGKTKSGSMAAVTGADELPAWLSPKRTIGGFYIVKALGGGAQSSVFIAKRSDEKDDPTAERYALKVPDYNASVSGNLSEQQFLQVFRAEASALLGLPPAPNLARFVTFDLGARPKPILVMELIVGPTLDAFIRTVAQQDDAKLTVGIAMEMLDGVLAGLSEMHRHGVGHLDLKPSNVILRDGRVPTLVDFGLAGRHIRPGCATTVYGAPEIWGVFPDDIVGEPSPLPADVYAFGCLAFEVLTGETLFAADTETAIVSKHITHDGHPNELDKLKAHPMLVKLLEGTLRKDPRARLPIDKLRAGFKALVPSLKDKPWPLGRG